MKPWAEKFYSSRDWREAREAYLISTGRLCERCLTNGEYEAADIVHHKVKLTQRNIGNPEITLNPARLEALCQKCHNKEHGSKQINLSYTWTPDGKVKPLPPIEK